ncbi:hypothetical protein PVAND_010450 [Polypedilum vanderplanki]|uniref:C2H2-type domain-containing protein n=1 Tax=Polypedilum vanderplanki TaxID=319348 RepID=A0A9J6CGM2_POLVA|nr:hypothetical protein PVAND_010450 [Polypedilum vanderplanki]
MEINVPTASPFFTGISNQIMYCISTPTWNTTSNATYSNELLKKHENAPPSIIQPQPITVSSTNAQLQSNQPSQYYYGTTQAIQSNSQTPTTNFNQTYSVTPAVNRSSVNNQNINPDEKNSTNYIDSNEINKSPRDSRFFEEIGRNFRCPICQKKFRQKGTLSQHERIHLDSKPYQCPHCERKFRQKSILHQHVRIHSDASAQLIYMNLGSNQGTLWPQNLPYPDEIRSEKSTNSEKDAVQIIHSIFGNEGLKNEENRNLQKSSMPQFVRCPICQKEFKQKSTLVQRGCIHIESRPYSCLVINCGKRFRQQSHLQQHNRIHTNSKPYKCPYQECQKFFRQQTILNQHIRVHTNSKPYSCKTCFREFRQQAILTNHEKSHMNSTYACPLTNCKRRFVTENDLKKHINDHMSPPKPKKQSSIRSNIDYKPQITFNHHQSSPYIYFNASSISQPRE